MLRSIDTARAPLLPRMGLGMVLRVLLKRPRAARAGAPGPLTSAFTLECLDRDHVRRYRQALGFAPAAAVPLTYWYLPVQRAHMATLLSDDFPYRLAGIVHVENTLIAHAGAHDPARADGAIGLATRIDILPPRASGAVYCALETVGTANGEPLFTCTSSYLAVRGARAGKPRTGHAPQQQGAVIDSWTLGPSSGRDYARISGDWNPIHLARWSARLMGLPRPIIHGMHTLARTCAALETAAGQQVTAISVRFTAPLPIGEAAVLTRGGAPGRYRVFCAGVASADGAFTLG